jgi:hypothetical protein
MRYAALTFAIAGCVPEPFLDPARYPPTDQAAETELPEETDSTDVTDDVPSDTDVPVDSEVVDTATWRPITTDTAVQLLLIGSWGLAEVEPGVSFQGTETFAVAALTSDNLWIDELFDLCRWERDAVDWANSGVRGDDPWAEALTSCPDCRFAFTVALTDARETSVHGDCGNVGVTKPPTEAFAYGFDDNAYIFGYGYYSVLQYFSPTTRDWRVATTINAYDANTKEFLYIWLNAVYGY